MAAPNHNADIYISVMVYDRLTMLENTVDNTLKLSHFTLEVMNELEPCFRVQYQVEPAEPARIGNEEYYSIAQRSVIADIVAAWVLMNSVGTILGGTGGGPAATTKFVSKAKAGSAEVEYDQYDIKKGYAGANMHDLISMYKKEAIRKARALGCLIDICEDCSLSVQYMLGNDTGVPFVLVGGCGCGC